MQHRLLENLEEKRSLKREYDQKYRLKNIEKLRLYGILYYRKHQEAKKAYSRIYRKQNHQEMLAYDKNQRLKRKLAVFNHYGNKCVCCGEDKLEFLTIDHINNDGAKQRKEAFGTNRTGGGGMYIWLLSHGLPLGYQTLCWNCNLAKANYDVCPHKKDAMLPKAVLSKQGSVRIPA